MKISQITVRASRSFSLRGLDIADEHYSPIVDLYADLEEGDDPQEKAKELRLEAESMISQHEREIREVHAVNLRVAQAAQVKQPIGMPDAGLRVSWSPPPMPPIVVTSAGTRLDHDMRAAQNSLMPTVSSPNNWLDHIANTLKLR